MIRVAAATAAPDGDLQDPYAPKPSITHQFRVPDRRPAAFISLVFACGALVPLFVLLVSLSAIKTNIQVSVKAAISSLHCEIAGLV